MSKLDETAVCYLLRACHGCMSRDKLADGFNRLSPGDTVGLWRALARLVFKQRVIVLYVCGVVHYYYKGVSNATNI